MRAEKGLGGFLDAAMRGLQTLEDARDAGGGPQFPVRKRLREVLVGVPFAEGVEAPERGIVCRPKVVGRGPP